MTESHTKGKRGGPRPGSGRPKGRLNDKTIARQQSINAAIERALSQLSESEIKQLSPLEVMGLAMHLMLESRDLTGALAAAKELAPYLHSRMGSNPPLPIMPEELLPDPAPQPDDDSPAEPVL